jgi:hypothetical protein
MMLRREGRRMRGRMRVSSLCIEGNRGGNMLIMLIGIEERQRLADAVKHHRDRNRAPSEPAGTFRYFDKRGRTDVR